MTQYGWLQWGSKTLHIVKQGGRRTLCGKICPDGQENIVAKTDNIVCLKCRKVEAGMLV